MLVARSINLAALGPLAHSHAHLITQLAAHQFEPGACRWSYQAMAAGMARTMGAIKRIIRQCASLGYITVERAARPGRGHINVYRIAERFFLRERDSNRERGKSKDSESVSNTESAAARAEDQNRSKLYPVIPRSAGDRQRTNRGWYGKLSEYMAACEPGAPLVSFWETTMALTDTDWWKGLAALPRDLKGYLNQIDLRMRASGWHRGREADIRRAEEHGARWACRDAGWRHVDR